MVKRGFKVTNISREKKIGIAAETLNEFLKKSCEKLMVEESWDVCKCYVAEDGTLVDDEEYFSTLPSQTLLVVVRPDEKMKTDFEHMYDMIRTTKVEYIQAGQHAQTFLNKNVDEKIRKIHECVVRDIQSKVVASLKAEDPHWFEGIDTNDKTKEAYMSRRAKDRMKGYLYKTKQMLITSPAYVHTSIKQNIKQELDLFIKKLQKLLEANKYNSHYFDRSADEQERLCNETGVFDCGGLWNRDKCKYVDDHLINPYSSREERILFQTWNLDHRIELSRSIVPSILEAVDHIHKPADSCYSCSKRIKNGHLSAAWYYKEIFTTENLKLVHIVCHDKGKHSDNSNVYIVCERCWKNEVAV